MTDVVTVGSPIEGGISVDLDEVRATPRADQWKHTDLLCGLVDHLRDELARTTGDLAVACEVARERAGTSGATAADRLASAATVFPAEESRTNPDGYVDAQIAETTALMRALWLAHHVEVMRLGGPVSDPARTFDAWLDAVRADSVPAALPWVEVRLDGSRRWHVFHFRTVAEAERWAHEGLGDWLADVGHIHDPAVCDDEH